MNACERLLKHYTLSKELLPGQSLRWLTAMRESALENFTAQGLPDSKNENWKYTRITELQETDYKPAPPPNYTLESLATAIKQHCSSEYCLVFINGCYQEHLSSLGTLPDGIILSSFAQALQAHPQLIADVLGKTANYQDNPFTALNTALISDGVFLWALENRKVDQPIHCLFLYSTDKQPVASHTRLLLVLNNNAQLTLVEHHIDISRLNSDKEEIEQAEASRNLSNTVTEILLSPQARMEHYRVQYDSLNNSHIAAMYVEQQRGSHFTSHSYSLGAPLARHDIQVKLAGRQAECTLNGAYLVDDSQHVDYHTQIEHAVPACSSQQVYKGVIQGHARAVFNGKVTIEPEAQQSSARQLNKNLLLAEKGEVDSKPELQIYADDVICTHGATVGQLDAQSLFYLQSRGFSKEDAQAWLAYGFISELLERISDPAMRQFIQQPVITRLEQLVGGEGNLQALLPAQSGIPS